MFALLSPRWGWLLLALLLWGSRTEAQEEEKGISSFAPSQYRIVRVHFPPQAGASQAAVSRGKYILNFGSREGVLRGSIFNVRSKGMLMGLVRVDRVWRDSCAASLVNLIHKQYPLSPYPLEVGYYLEPKLVLLETIQFEAGEPAIDPAMHERLHYAARFIRAYPDFPLIIEGHTDASGKATENQRLSEKRAERIRNYLHEIHRLPLGQMFVKGYGESDPIATNATPEGRALNRRVDIVLAAARPDSTASAPGE